MLPAAFHSSRVTPLRDIGCKLRRSGNAPLSVGSPKAVWVFSIGRSVEVLLPKTTRTQAAGFPISRTSRQREEGLQTCLRVYEKASPTCLLSLFLTPPGSPTYCLLTSPQCFHSSITFPKPFFAMPHSHNMVPLQCTLQSLSPSSVSPISLDTRAEAAVTVVSLTRQHLYTSQQTPTSSFPTRILSSVLSSLPEGLLPWTQSIRMTSQTQSPRRTDRERWKSVKQVCRPIVSSLSGYSWSLHVSSL